MLSTAKIRNGSWRYYANQVQHGACEYFLGLGEAPGRWQGRGLEALGLDLNAVVSERELEGLFSRALHPRSREQLGRAWRPDGVTGYDLCFSAPKSVSTLWAVGDGAVPLQVVAAHRAAVAAGMAYLDAHASYSRVGTNGHMQVATGGFAAAVFGHRTSRAGDPQLHSHALVVNKVRCGDGEWRTIDGHEIYAHKKSAGTIYQAALRGELTPRLGVAWTPVTKDGQAEIAGVPKELMDTFSKRATQIAGESAPVIAVYEAELGRAVSSAERTAVMKVAVLKTRPGKDPVDIIALSDRWESEAAAVGWTGPLLQASIGRATAATPRLDPPDLATVGGRVIVEALAAAGSRRAVFTRSDLAGEVAARVPVVGFTADQVRDVVEHWTDAALTTPEAVTLRPNPDGPCRASDDRYASRTTLDAELRILHAADTGRGAGVAVLDPRRLRQVAQARGLDGSQQAALIRVASSGDAVSVLVAPAGTGKTTALGAAVHAWQQAGHRTVLLAPSARAAAELRDATGTPADTVAKFLLTHGTPLSVDTIGLELGQDRIQRGDVVILDEASMLATSDLDRLRHATWAVDAKLLLIGDPAQIGAVDAAGGMLPALAERLHAPTLETVHRFSETWERHASLRLRHGDTTVIDEYAAAGRVHDCPDDTTAYRTVLDQYVNAIAAGRSALMLARTHRDVDALNDLARAHAIDTGQVHGPVLADGDIQWRAGDRLRATRNNRTISVAGDFLRNGDQFTVTGIDREGLIVDAFDGRGTTQLPADYIAEHTAYGWATTIDASQGATVDHGTLLARPGLDREHLYVGLTRGRRRNNVVVAQPSTEIDHHSPPRTEADRSAVEVLRETLRTSDAQTAAHTQLPGAEQPQVAAPPTPSEPAGRAPGRRVSAVPDDWTPRPRPAIYRDDDYHQSIHQDIGRDSSRGR